VTALSPAQVRELKGIWEEHVRFEDHRNLGVDLLAHPKIWSDCGPKHFKIRIFSSRATRRALAMPTSGYLKNLLIKGGVAGRDH